MKVFFTSDLHFGHKNIIQYDQRPFSSVDEMDAALIERWNRKVSQEDLVYILGDISWYGPHKTYEIFQDLHGRKRLITGNHDKLNDRLKSLFEKIESYDEIKVDGKTVVMCHYPIGFYNKHHHGAIMLYGHIHNNEEDVYMDKIKDFLNCQNMHCEMYNVGCMHWDYEPVTLQEITGSEEE